MTVSRIFADLLESRRSYFNQRFLQARWESPGLDPSAFLRLVGEVLDPLVVRLAEENQPDKLPGVVESLYDALLTLYERNLLGERRLIGSVQQVWTDLLPSIPQHLMAETEKVVAAVCNAVVHLSFHAGADHDLWMRKMQVLGSTAADVDTLLTAGQVLAWRCGMAQYRQSALGLAETLDEKILSTIFDLPQTTKPENALTAMVQDPWWRPGEKAVEGLQVGAVVGDFAGFGGVFLSPPWVSANVHHFIAQDRNSTWALFADAYGHAFMPINGRHLAVSDHPSGLSVSEHGVLTTKFGRLHLPHFTALRSIAALPHTIAVTQICSHRIILVRV